MNQVLIPIKLKRREAHPTEPRLPMPLEKIWRISETVRFLLSVRQSTMMAQLPGPNPSYVTACNLLASIFLPFKARSIFSFGILTAFAAEMAASSLILVAIHKTKSPQCTWIRTTCSDSRWNTLRQFGKEITTLNVLVCFIVLNGGPMRMAGEPTERHNLRISNTKCDEQWVGMFVWLF